MAGVSSGAQVPLPQMLGPPTGSMPIRLPQVRKRRERVVRGITRSTMMAGREPNWAVSLISPDHHSLPHAFIYACIVLPDDAYNACLMLVHHNAYTLMDSCTVHAKHSKHVQLKKMNRQLVVLASSQTR